MKDPRIELQLRQRFVKDHGLPITVFESPYFDYFLDLYRAKPKWDRLEKEIEERFEGNPGKWLDHYFKLRNTIIEDLERSEQYQAFNNDPTLLDRFKTSGQIDRDVYSGSNVGKRFLSLDLKKANFQALYYVIPEIFKGAKTYEEFIGLYDESKIFQESKYTRQVIFGKLNPKRQITVEKWLISEIERTLNLDLPLYSKRSDELIWEGELGGDRDLVKEVKDGLGLDVKVEQFELEMIQKFTVDGRSVLGFVKNYPDKPSTLHGVKSIYYPQIYKAWKGMELNEKMDLVFMYEEQLAHFDYSLV